MVVVRSGQEGLNMRQPEKIKVHDETERAADRIPFQKGWGYPHILLAALCAAVLQGSAEVDEVRLHRPPTQTIDGAVVLISSPTQKGLRTKVLWCAGEQK